MQKAKELHIISHSHWDREWYMSWPKHNYRLVRLIDQLIETMEQKPEFRHFQLDGQVVLVEDYLAVRPEMRERLVKLIRDGRIKIGPFYILQDEFLISGESTVRNALYGIRESRKYGEPVLCGYFPDAFGHVSQIPQIMRGFGIDCAYFGRGIIPEGYWEEFAGKPPLGFAEINWEGADGSTIVGIQFSHWYDNAAQLPSDEAEALARFKKILGLTEITSMTPYHLGMNGSDHMPVQTDLPEIFGTVGDKAGVKLVHSCVDEYFEKIKPYRDGFCTYKGEITGQNGTGYRTLINTASARIYLKQQNFRAQRALAEIAEPLSVMSAASGGRYEEDILYWCWKKLMKNFPHDSICCCSVDEVCDKMRDRYTDATDTAESLTADVLAELVAKIPAKGDGKRIAVLNADPFEGSGLCGYKAVYLSGERIPSAPALYDEEGNEIPCSFSRPKKTKRYILPYDRFREVQDVTELSVRFRAENVPGLGYKNYYLREREKKTLPERGVRVMPGGAENAFFLLKFREDGSFLLTDKESGRTAGPFNYFEDIGDKGNEYEFIADGDPVTTLGKKARVRLVSFDAVLAVFETECTLGEGRKAVKIVSRVTAEAESPIVRVETKFVNKRGNHRVRAAFDAGVNTDKVLAEGQFDFVERNIIPTKRWKNPCNPQRMDGSVVLQEKDFGCMVTPRGLNEYEVSADGKNVLYVTLMRAVGEMGDWFYFPTPGGQCLGECSAEYAVMLYGGEKEFSLAARESSAYRMQKLVACGGKGKADASAAQNLFGLKRKGLVSASAVKQAEDGKGYIVRLYNPSCEEAEISAETPFDTVNMAEDKTSCRGLTRLAVPPKKIVTLYFQK